MVKIKCQKCKYEWETKSKLFSVTCPCCGYKTSIKSIEKEVKNE